ncbi:MAG: hypothetical protein AB4038_05065 [Prochloraceae cyanobacterium]
MKTTNFLTSTCRYCRYYKPEGRRGGTCHRLGVPVQSNWKACALAVPPFASTWETLTEIMFLENSLALDSSEYSGEGNKEISTKPGSLEIATKQAEKS